MFKDILLKDVIDTIGEGVLVLDKNCLITLWNKAMEEMTGQSAKKMLGRHCSVLACSGHLPENPDEKSLVPETDCSLLSISGGQASVRRQECRIKGKNGESIPVLKNTSLLMNDQNQPSGIVITLTDLRPLKHLQADLAVMRHDSMPVRRLGKLSGDSKEMQELYERIRLAGNSDVTVLIEGETGTGKELTAEAIHSVSARKNGPLVRVNCSALSESLLESELFGHVKGAFTGAVKNKAGRIELAEGGTLFLDEIGDISPTIQLKLLRVLQEHVYERVGESVPRKANIRVIAATHRSLKQLVEEGSFREDLFYRVRVYSITVPPLRSHKKDIPLLCSVFMQKLNAGTGKNIQNISTEAMHCLMDYCWPGNIRELENAIEHAFVACRDSTIEQSDLPPEIRSDSQREIECRKKTAKKTSPSRRVTKESLEEELKSCGWNQAETARRFGINRTTLWRKMKQWRISRPD